MRKISSILWSLFITIRRLTGRLRSLAKKKKRERFVSRGRMVSRHAKSFTPACMKRHQVHSVVELLQPMQSQLGPISFHFIEAERHRYTTIIKSIPRLFKMELFCREEYAVISTLRNSYLHVWKKNFEMMKHAGWNLTRIVLFNVHAEYQYRYIHLFSLFQLNFQKSIRIWSRLNILKCALL